MIITLTGQNDKNKNIQITMPVNPEKLQYSSAGKFQEYEILNKGTAKIPNGKEIATVSWDCFFPGDSLEDYPFIVKYEQPKVLHNQIDYWCKQGTKLTLTITESPFTQIPVYVESYAAQMAGADGSIYYSLKLGQAIDVAVSTVPKKSGQTTGNKRPSKTTNAKKYTIKSGDTLWKIAKKFLKKGTEWKKIYNANKDVIEARAKKAGRKSSDKGNWIYPGTILKIPA